MKSSMILLTSIYIKNSMLELHKQIDDIWFLFIEQDYKEDAFPGLGL